MRAGSPLRLRGPVWGPLRAMATSARSLVAVVVGLAVLAVYLRASQQLAVLAHPDRSAGWVQLLWVEDWPSTLLRMRGPWLWEPAGSITLAGRWMLLLAPMNGLLSAALAILVAWNIALALWAYPHRGASATSVPLRGGVGSLVAAIPSLLTSAACCAPALLVGLGSSLATAGATLVSLLPYGLPLSLAALALNGWWTARRLATASPGCPVPDLGRCEVDADRGRLGRRSAELHAGPAPKGWR